MSLHFSDLTMLLRYLLIKTHQNYFLNINILEFKKISNESDFLNTDITRLKTKINDKKCIEIS